MIPPRMFEVIMLGTLPHAASDAPITVEGGHWADCSSLEDGARCHAQGADIIGTTLSGYTSDVVPNAPDLPLVQALSAKGYRVIAEGRFNSPELAAQAMQHGAWAVTVGSAITRLEHICQWYREAMTEETVC